jgi:hypothetical protein
MTEDPHLRMAAFDEYLANTSWDKTYAAMRELIDAASRRPALPPAATAD